MLTHSLTHSFIVQAKGVLEIQLALIHLYTDNLNSIATQSALLAGFAFTGE